MEKNTVLELIEQQVHQMIIDRIKIVSQHTPMVKQYN